MSWLENVFAIVICTQYSHYDMLYTFKLSNSSGFMELPFCMQICYFKIIQSSETEPILHVMIVCKELLTHYKYKCQTQSITRLSLVGLKRPGMSTILH